MHRDKALDKAVTRQMILDPKRPPYLGGENWLGHGVREGMDAQMDYLLLDGATMEQFLKLRNTEASVRSHFQSLKKRNGLQVARDSDGKYKFDRQQLEISVPVTVAKSRSKVQLFPEEVAHTDGLLEGAVCTISVDAYERNPKARKECIARYGPTCVICGFNFEKAYGRTARGFIHVHHLKPLWKIGKEHKVDPVRDLRPVCPNCHAVIHMDGEPKTIDQVKQLLKQTF